MDFLVLPSYPPILKRYEEAQEAEYFRHQKQKHCDRSAFARFRYYFE